MDNLEASDTWVTKLNFEDRILAPDGWDRGNFRYSFGSGILGQGVQIYSERDCS
jgi:hypothetical protein